MVMGRPRRWAQGAVSLFLPHRTPSLGLPVRDTHSRSWGSLGSSFSIFASGTLGESRKGVSGEVGGHLRKAAQVRGLELGVLMP